MSFLIRNGTLSRVLEQSATVRKAEGPTRPMTADEVAESHDALLSSLGGSRFFVDARAQGLAKHEGIERHRRQVAKADADRDAALTKAPLVLPTEERRRNEAAAPKATSVPAVATDSKFTKAALQEFTKSIETARAEFEEAMKRRKEDMAKLPPDDDGGDDDDGTGGTPAIAIRESPAKAKPGTSNLIHEPSKDGVHAKRDGRTITSTHAINRKIQPAKVSKAATPESGPFIDLASWFRHRPA